MVAERAPFQPCGFGHSRRRVIGDHEGAGPFASNRKSKAYRLFEIRSRRETLPLIEQDACLLPVAGRFAKQLRRFPCEYDSYCAVTGAAQLLVHCFLCLMAR